MPTWEESKKKLEAIKKNTPIPPPVPEEKVWTWEAVIAENGWINTLFEEFKGELAWNEEFLDHKDQYQIYLRYKHAIDAQVGEKASKGSALFHRSICDPDMESKFPYYIVLNKFLDQLSKNNTRGNKK